MTTATARYLPNRPVPTGRREFYECGICGAWHSVQWNGDCRQDSARFFPEDLDAAFGPLGWNEVDQPGAEAAQ